MPFLSIRHLLLGTFLLLCLVAPAAYAQHSEPFCDTLDFIAPGETIRGAITDEASAVLVCFEGQAGDEVIIDMTRTGGRLDPYLILADAFYNEVYSENDDAVISTRDARITFTLPQDGAYLILATRYQLERGTSEGEFALTLTQAGEAPAVIEGDGDPFPTCLAGITPGDETAGRIDDVQFGYVYCFSGAAGDELLIDMTRAEGDLDPYLIVMRPAFSVDDLGVVAVGDDRHLASTDAQVRLSLPESGTYLLVATRDGLRGGVTSGVFVLRLAVVPGE